jgi:hypothetical protein
MGWLWLFGGVISHPPAGALVPVKQRETQMLSFDDRIKKWAPLPAPQKDKLQ